MTTQTRYAGQEWLKVQLGIKADKISPLGLQVADILGIVFRGLYHIHGAVRNPIPKGRGLRTARLFERDASHNLTSS